MKGIVLGTLIKEDTKLNSTRVYLQVGYKTRVYKIRVDPIFRVKRAWWGVLTKEQIEVIQEAVNSMGKSVGLEPTRTGYMKLDLESRERLERLA